MASTARSLPRARRAPASVNVDRVHYRQEAIYVSYLGTAEILGPSA